MALAGLRSTAFLGGDQLLGAHEALATAANRLVPLVLHVANGDLGHAGYHGVADCGFFQVLPASGQEALDLSLVARWLTERALVPGLVATDGLALERLRLPDEGALRSYLSEPDEPIQSPTEAQRMLFGTDRARVLRWFDPDHPVATGGIRGLEDEARARRGNRLFFQSHVSDLARQGMEALTAITGRPLSLLRRSRLEDAELVLVTQGALVQAAEAVADYLRRAHAWKVGVLGVTWLRPLPAAELAEALKGRSAVAVVESLDGRLATEPPLFRELRGAVGSADGWVSATCASGVPEPAQLSGLCELLRRSDRPRAVQLDQGSIPEATGFPRRDALLQALGNDYPGLREAGLPDVASLPGPDDGCSVGLVGREAELPLDAFSLLADAVAAEAGPFVRGGATRRRPGVWEARVRAAKEDFADPGIGAPVSLLLIASKITRELGEPINGLGTGGTVLVASEDPPERVWSELPAQWRHIVRERGLRLLRVGEPLETGLEALRACIRAEDQALLEAGDIQEIVWRELPEPEARDRDLPRLVRRIERIRSAHDSLPRFWGEVVQPREGATPDGVADPLAASGAVPAAASALGAEPAVPGIPVLDSAACTGCGRCWTACPDAAIGVTALGIEDLLTSVSHLAGTEGRAADALRRAHKHLAGRLASQISKSDARELREEDCREGWSWLSERLNLSDEERAEHEAAFDATIERVLRLRPAATQAFLVDAEEQKKGAGALLVLAIDPRACLGCNICVAECPEDALTLEERSPECVSQLEDRWRDWEALPDTPGEILALSADHPEVGPMAAVLLSRHAAQSQVGGAPGEAGSGERLAARLVAGVVEQHAQQRIAGLTKTLEERTEVLEQKARELLIEGLSKTDMDTLSEAVGRVSRGTGGLSELGEHLRTMGAPANFDRPAVLRTARLAGELEAYRKRLAEGEDGLGRARFGVVVTHGTVAEWAARFPLHPYYAPLTLAPNADGVELARGIARGLVAEHLRLQRYLRWGSLESDPPPDRSVRLDAIEGITWEDLDIEEQVACPPLLLMGDDISLLEHGFEALTRLLASDLPVKIVLLDGRGRLDAVPDPALVAMAHRRAFVLSGSPAHPDHLARGLSDALAWPGPALIHIHAPSPTRHGFPADACLERARQAVEGRAQILFRYDPRAEGHFGLRASLEGNPEPDQDWGANTFVDWAAGESRFGQHLEPVENGGGVSLEEWLARDEDDRGGALPVIEVGDSRLRVGPPLARAAADRLALWGTLRELTGAASPFTERIRAELEQELGARHQEEMDALKAEHETRVAEVAAGADQQALTRLRDRLITLSNLGARSEPGGNGV
jgi:pyruvate-ferredoxin/flavodoxin oxidoreductase